MKPQKEGLVRHLLVQLLVQAPIVRTRLPGTTYQEAISGDVEILVVKMVVNS